MQAWTGEFWTAVDSANAAAFLTSSFSSGYTTIQAVPEPSAWALLGLGVGGWLILRTRMFITGP